MTGLVRAELLRFISRRLFRAIGAIAVLLVLVSVVISFLQSSNDPDAGLEAARRDVAACEASRGQFEGEKFPTEQPESGFFCPTVEDLAGQYDKRFDYVDTMPDVSRLIAVALFVLSFVVGASFMGAEWGSGAMTTLLTWEPRRGRVLVAKVIAGTLLMAAASVLLLALIAVVYLPVASLRGTTRGLDGSVWWTLFGVWARGAGLAMFGSAVAMAISTITRNTAGAVGVAFGYGVILDPLLGVIRRGAYIEWLLQYNIARFLGFVDLPQRQPDVSTGFVQTQEALGISRPAILFAIYAAIALGIAYATMRSRDAA